MFGFKLHSEWRSVAAGSGPLDACKWRRREFSFQLQTCIEVIDIEDHNSRSLKSLPPSRFPVSFRDITCLQTFIRSIQLKCELNWSFHGSILCQVLRSKASQEMGVVEFWELLCITFTFKGHEKNTPHHPTTHKLLETIFANCNTPNIPTRDILN